MVTRNGFPCHSLAVHLASLREIQLMQAPVKRQIRWCVVTAALAGLPAGAAVAQSTQEALLNRLEQELLDAQIEQRLATHAGQTVFERMSLDYGASLRLGIAGLQNSSGSDSTLFQYEANVFANVVFDGGHRFFGNLRFLYNQYDVQRGSNDTGFLIPYGNRYWYEFDLKALQRATEGTADEFGLNIRAGRQFLNWNSGLVFSNDFYGVRLRADYEQFSLESMVGVTARSGFYDFDPGRTGYDSSTDRLLYGVRGAYDFGPGLELFVSGFWQRDHNSNLENVELAPGVVYLHDFTMNSSYLSFGGSGTIGTDLLWTTEIVRESGRSPSRMTFAEDLSILQGGTTIDAWAGVVNLAWTPSGVTTRPRIDATLAMGSGDVDRFTVSHSPTGNLFATSDLNFQSLGYINTGLAAAPTISNLIMLRVGGSTGIDIDARRPDALRVGMDVFIYGKQKSNAPLSIPSGSGQKFAGFEVDWKVDWRLASDVSFTARAGFFFPGPGVSGDADFTRHFIYGGFTYAF